MVFFKILLIFLIAAPVIFFAFYLYSQMLGYINAKNREEKLRRGDRK